MIVPLLQLGISLDETVTSEDLDDLLFVLGAPSVVRSHLHITCNMYFKLTYKYSKVTNPSPIEI